MTGTRFHFAVVIFLAAFLLFLVEPIAAKQLVPILGGSAAVWITCLVFFLTALLCAYAYAHWIARSVHWGLHLLLLVAAVGFAQVWAFRSIDLSNGAEHPVTTIFFALTLWIGLPFIALGASSPLLQYWWSRVESGPIPYRLFALSNLASLLALAAYPVWIEPRFTLHDQRIAWFWGFVGFAVLAAGLTLRSRSSIQTTSLPAVADLKSAPASSPRLSPRSRCCGFCRWPFICSPSSSRSNFRGCCRRCSLRAFSRSCWPASFTWFRRW